MAVALKHQQLKISGMTCAACVGRVERVLAKQKGVVTASVNLATESAYIEHTAEFDLQTVLDAVKKAGYSVSQDHAAPADNEEEGHKAAWQMLLAMLITAVLMLPMVSSWTAPVWLQWLLATPVQFWLGARFFKGALGALRNREANMDVLVVLGTLTSYLFSVYVWFTSTPDSGKATHLYFEASSEAPVAEAATLAVVETPVMSPAVAIAPAIPEMSKPVAATAISKEQLVSNLSAVGLTWVETDQGKWSDVQRLLEQTPQAIRIARVRKELPPVSSEPLMQVETRAEFRSNQAGQ